VLLAAAQSGGPAPYKDSRGRTLEYNGPGREEPEPGGLEEIRIGYYGPDDPGHPSGGTLWAGARLAVEEANRDGGFKGLPFRLVPRWTDDPWRTGASAVVKMAYADRVWAIIGGIDGATTHLAEQVVVKARLTLVDPASTDQTVNYASVPWMFSCLPSGAAYADAMAAEVRGKSFALFSATDHDSRALAAELLTILRRDGSIPKRRIEFQPGARDAARMAEETVEATAVLVAGAADMAALARQLRSRLPRIALLAGPEAGRAVFREQAGAAAEGVRYPTAGGPERADFPDYTAQSAYDATRTVIAAIRAAGLNRVRIRDVIAALPRWDSSGRDTRPVRMIAIQRH